MTNTDTQSTTKNRNRSHDPCEKPVEPRRGQQKDLNWKTLAKFTNLRNLRLSWWTVIVRKKHCYKSLYNIQSPLRTDRSRDWSVYIWKEVCGPSDWGMTNLHKFPRPGAFITRKVAVKTPRKEKERVPKLPLSGNKLPSPRLGSWCKKEP